MVVILPPSPVTRTSDSVSIFWIGSNFAAISSGCRLIISDVDDLFVF